MEYKNILLKKQWISGTVIHWKWNSGRNQKGNLKKYLETNDNENMMTQNYGMQQKQF